jgi:hypothetical protein
MLIPRAVDMALEVSCLAYLVWGALIPLLMACAVDVAVDVKLLCLYQRKLVNISITFRDLLLGIVSRCKGAGLPRCEGWWNRNGHCCNLCRG